jgi:hypothetical protein
MDIHKPKPWHNLRELASEIAVVVVGILIALSLEQVAEALKEHRAAAEARDAIRHEIADDLAQLKIVESGRPCVERRLGEIQGLLEKANRGEAFTAPIWIGRPRVYPVTTSSWTAANSAGRLSLWSSREQADYGNVYYRLGLVQQYDDAQQELWSDLRALEGRKTLTAEMVDQYLRTVHRARYESFRLKGVFVRASEAADRIGVKANNAYVPLGVQMQMTSACLPMDTPPDKATAMTGGIGEPN